jgi:hypothetical protein
MRRELEAWGPTLKTLQRQEKTTGRPMGRWEAGPRDGIHPSLSFAAKGLSLESPRNQLLRYRPTPCRLQLRCSVFRWMNPLTYDVLVSRSTRFIE